jgi:glutamine---fructose-6-phosphate transaminase (isomerizing)
LKSYSETSNGMCTMCGMVGCVGKERCVEVLLDGLRKLEYRGYDSAGLALALLGSGLETAKEVGPLVNHGGRP